MATRSFSSYQIQFEYHKELNEKQKTLLEEWNQEILINLINKIKGLNYEEKQMTTKDKALIMEEAFMIHTNQDLVKREDEEDDVNNEEQMNAIVGKMKFVEHGTIRDYWDVEQYKSRPSDKKRTEGEQKHFHFIIRMEDGFMLLQNDVIFTRSKMDKYLSDLFMEKVDNNKKDKYINVSIANLLKRGFFEELNELDSVKEVVLEVKKDKPKIIADENEFIKKQQEESAKLDGTHIQIIHKAKRTHFKKNSVIKYLKEYKGDKNITTIKVKGHQADAEKTIDVNKYREKFSGEFDTDLDTNLVNSTDVYQYLYEVIKKREIL